MNCKNCDNITPVWGKEHKKYCDLKCQREYESKSGKKHFDAIKCICCNAVFIPKSIQNRCCSRKCKGKIDGQKRSKKPPTKKCQFCEKIFVPYNSLDKFCNASCRINNQKSKRSRNWKTTENIIGEKNPCFRTGLNTRTSAKSSVGEREYIRTRKQISANILEEHGYLFCQKCGASNKKLETHHIVFRSEKPMHEHIHNPRNLILVCVQCHNDFHAKKGNRNRLVIERGLNELFGNDVLDKN